MLSLSRRLCLVKHTSNPAQLLLLHVPMHERLSLMLRFVSRYCNLVISYTLHPFLVMHTSIHRLAFVRVTTGVGSNASSSSEIWSSLYVIVSNTLYVRSVGGVPVPAEPTRDRSAADFVLLAARSSALTALRSATLPASLP